MRSTFLVFFWVLKLRSSDETCAALFFDRLEQVSSEKDQCFLETNHKVDMSLFNVGKLFDRL